VARASRVAHLALSGLAAWALGVSIGIAPAAATTIFQLQNVENNATAQAVASDFDGGSDDSGLQVSNDNPASVEADAAVPGFASHGEAQASYTVTDTTLELHGHAAAIGFADTEGAATGFGQASFSANQDFGLDEVLVHVVGTLTRDEANVPTGSIAVTFSIGTYIQILQFGVNGTLAFDDVVPLAGLVSITAGATESQPHAQGVIDSGEVGYDVTMTILPVPEPSTACLLALGSVLIAGSSRFSRPRA
jgi:hypothetical protein